MHLRVGMHAFTQYLNGNHCYLHGFDTRESRIENSIKQNTDYVVFVLKIPTRFVNLNWRDKELGNNYTKDDL